MRKIFEIVIVFFTILFIFVSCGNKVKRPLDYIVVNTDTVSINQLGLWFPAADNTEIFFGKKCFILAVSSTVSNSEKKSEYKEILKDFTEQMSKETGCDWKIDGAEKLYIASKIINDNMKNFNTFETFESFLKKTEKTIVVYKNGIKESLSKKYFSISPEFARKYNSSTDKNRLLSQALYSLFCSTEHLAKIVAQFIISVDSDAQETDSLNNMVKGLFDESVVDKKQISKRKRASATRDNSKVALKYRDQASIQKTISKHIPNLKVLYKKELKNGNAMFGVMYVTFRVAPSGKTVSTSIKSSQISSRQFQNSLLDYVKKIRFKSIPENVGYMSFDFPFEFDPEY